MLLMVNEVRLFTFCHWIHGCDVNVVKNYLNTLHRLHCENTKKKFQILKIMDKISLNCYEIPINALVVHMFIYIYTCQDFYIYINIYIYIFFFVKIFSHRWPFLRLCEKQLTSSERDNSFNFLWGYKWWRWLMFSVAAGQTATRKYQPCMTRNK